MRITYQSALIWPADDTGGTGTNCPSELPYAGSQCPDLLPKALAGPPEEGPILSHISVPVTSSSDIFFSFYMFCFSNLLYSFY